MVWNMVGRAATTTIPNIHKSRTKCELKLWLAIDIMVTSSQGFCGLPQQILPILWLPYTGQKM